MLHHVAFEAQGKTVSFRMDVNRMIQLQRRMGLAEDWQKFWKTLAAALDDLDLPVLKKIVCYGVLEDLPEMTEDAAGDLITDVGLPRILKIVAEGLRWAIPEKKEPEPGEKGESRPSDGPTSS